MLTTAIGRLRLIGTLEGTSFLVLLLIAMPLKYWADMPLAVTIVGALHGLLFVLYLLAVLNVWITERWSFLKVLLAGIASVLPFGPFIVDKKLLQNQK
jgi:integral membrane protein